MRSGSNKLRVTSKLGMSPRYVSLIVVVVVVIVVVVVVAVVAVVAGGVCMCVCVSPCCFWQ